MSCGCRARTGRPVVVPVLATERLLLRPRDHRDIDAFVAMDSDRDVRRYLPPAFRDHFEAETYRALLPQRMAMDFGPGLGHWSMVLAEDPDFFIGTALLIPVGGEGRDIEIGWRLRRICWGQGYATEAAKKVLAHAAGLVAPGDLVALIHPDNAASIGVAAKIGFTRAGIREAYGTTFDLYRHGRQAS